jgi:hypothetical protein
MKKKPSKLKFYLLFPLVALMARAPGTKDQCMITLVAMVGSVALWGVLIAGATKALV